MLGDAIASKKPSGSATLSVVGRGRELSAEGISLVDCTCICIFFVSVFVFVFVLGKEVLEKVSAGGISLLVPSSAVCHNSLAPLSFSLSLSPKQSDLETKTQYTLKYFG